MLYNLRNFAKTKAAGVLVAILIVPFVLWGMGGVFSGGNKNNIAKINKTNISTQDFTNYINSKGIDQNKIREGIDQNILEELLSELISRTLLSMEVKDHNLIISDKILKKRIKKNINFQDENNKFSRTKYEKFLLSTSQTAPRFEIKLKQNELRKNLFDYISGGLKSPYFLVDNTFKEKTKKLSINYINISKIYRKKESFTQQEINKYLELNEDSLKEKTINFNYVKITPKELIGLDEFNNVFFEKIDELENEILNGTTFANIKLKYNLNHKSIDNFKNNDDKETDNSFIQIYEEAEINKIGLLEENDYYILYEITDLKKTVPNIYDVEFVEKIKQLLFDQSRFEFNNNLIQKISKKEFIQSDFDSLSKNNLNKTEINSINDDKTFTKESLKYLYSLSRNNYGLISDAKKNIFLIKVVDVKYKNISRESKDYTLYKKETDDKIKNNIYSSYDIFINNKFKIKINEKTLERVKNYFR